jgi:hypothetical protein
MVGGALERRRHGEDGGGCGVFPSLVAGLEKKKKGEEEIRRSM